MTPNLLIISGCAVLIIATPFGALLDLIPAIHGDHLARETLVAYALGFVVGVTGLLLHM